MTIKPSNWQKSKGTIMKNTTALKNTATVQPVAAEQAQQETTAFMALVTRAEKEIKQGKVVELDLFLAEL